MVGGRRRPPCVRRTGRSRHGDLRDGRETGSSRSARGRGGADRRAEGGPAAPLRGSGGGPCLGIGRRRRLCRDRPGAGPRRGLVGRGARRAEGGRPAGPRHAAGLRRCPGPRLRLERGDARLPAPALVRGPGDGAREPGAPAGPRLGALRRRSSGAAPGPATPMPWSSSTRPTPPRSRRRTGPRSSPRTCAPRGSGSPRARSSPAARRSAGSAGTGSSWSPRATSGSAGGWAWSGSCWPPWRAACAGVDRGAPRAPVPAPRRCSPSSPAAEVPGGAGAEPVA